MLVLRAALSIGGIAAAAAFTRHNFSFDTRVALAPSISHGDKISVTLFSPLKSRRSSVAMQVFMSQSWQTKSGMSHELHLFSFDALASTERSRSWMAVSVALKVWPTLRFDMENLGIDPISFDWEHKIAGPTTDGVEDGKSFEWLLQKLSALSSITQQGDTPDDMLGCDAVFLARLLVEEQRLDGGRSNGRGGKYGGRFHPSSSSDYCVGGRSKVGSRPLTVGELFANWSELREVVRMKYPFIEQLSEGKQKEKDPLPEIRKRLTELFNRADIRSKILPSWQSHAYDMLFDYESENHDGFMNLRNNVVLVLGHEAQIPWALEALSSLGSSLDVKSDLDFPGRADMVKMKCKNRKVASEEGNSMRVVVTNSEHAHNYIMNGEAERASLVLVVPNSLEGQRHSSMILNLITCMDKHEPAADFELNTNVVHSSLEVLRGLKLHLGDDAPRLSDGLRKCQLPNSDINVTLFLPEWADNVHPMHGNEAEMDPWMNLAGQAEFLQEMTGRVIGSPLA